MTKQPGKRDDVLNATLSIIADHGFHAAPMSQIAEKANIGVGTIYRYFKNKEELIDALYLEVRTRMAKEILKGEVISEKVKDQFIHYMQNLICYLTQHPSEIYFSQQYENSPFITEETRGEVNRIASPIADLFTRARNENLLKDLPDALLMSLFTGASMALLKECLRNKSLRGQIDKGIEAIWDMLTTKKG